MGLNYYLHKKEQYYSQYSNLDIIKTYNITFHKCVYVDNANSAKCCYSAYISYQPSHIHNIFIEYVCLYI